MMLLKLCDIRALPAWKALNFVGAEVASVPGAIVHVAVRVLL